MEVFTNDEMFLMQIQNHLETAPYFPLGKWVEPLVPVCKQAIDAMNNNDPFAQILLPGKSVWVNRETLEPSRTCAAIEICRIYGLQIFLNSDWD